MLSTTFALITVIHATSSCIRFHSALLTYSISFADKIGSVHAPLFCQCEGHPCTYCKTTGKKEDRRRTNTPPSPPPQLTSAYLDLSCRRLQDHQSVEGRDFSIPAHIRGGIERMAACRDLECDYCVRSRNLTITVEVTTTT